MPSAVIERVYDLGRCEPAILTFTNQQGRDISDSNPQDADPGGVLDDDSVIIYPAVKIPGMDVTVNPAEIAGVDPDFIVEPTGVDMDINVPVEDTAIAVNGLKQKDLTHGAPMAPNAEPTTSPKKTRSPAKARSPVKETADPRTGMAARNNRVRKAPEKYVPSMKGNKFANVRTQITSLLCGSKDALCMEQRLV
jgi:hypothetical protein